MGEIVSINQANQFVYGHSAYECGFYAVAMVCSMAPLGKPPILSPGQISNLAQQWYAQYNGDNGPGNMNGMSLKQLYDLLAQVKLEYHPQPCNIAAIRSEIISGHPVIIAVAESSVYDVQLQGNPYPWNPAGNHVIVVTGLSGSNLLVRDSASIQPPNTLRPGPRVYAPSLQIVSCTAVVPHFTGVPVSAPNVPQGWKDDGTTLTAPNGFRVVKGFRQFVLSNRWDYKNWPLEEEHGMSQLEFSDPSLGGGTQQVFRTDVLEWTQARGVFRMWVGQEILALRRALHL